jgi:putative transcriptional regulator
VSPDPGTLLIAAPAQDNDATFARSVLLVIDREPSGITTGLVLNRRLQRDVTETSALALLFVPDPSAAAYWGGPMGSDPAVLAQFSSVDGLEWFHLPKTQRRPMPLPDVGVIAVAEHPDVFEGRVRRARVFIGLCVWASGQVERELERGDWRTARATPDDLFTARPDDLWQDLSAR